MNELTTVQQHLPTNIEDLAKFVLVGREKLVSVRAEIRAIDKLNIAEGVRQQKRDEAQMLSEALLDAEVRIGELLKRIPKMNGIRTDLQPCDSGVHRFEKPKLEIVQDLGFTPKQANRFETLAANKDIVEQVKAEARENEDIPTRSRVLQLVQEKNRKPVDPIDHKYDSIKDINDALSKPYFLEIDPEKLSYWFSTFKDEDEYQFRFKMVNDAIKNLQLIKSYLSRKEVTK